jgi:hypothetical protein
MIIITAIRSNPFDSSGFNAEGKGVGGIVGVSIAVSFVGEGVFSESIV